MSTILDTLRRIDKTYYTVADLKKITGLSLNSLYVTLSRLVGKRLLIRLTSGVYILAEKYSQIDVIANMLYQPSYLSFESALSRYGILSQIPYVLTFATTKKSLRKTLGQTTVEFRTLQKPLFFGYEKNDSLFIATPEKALMDTMYLVTFGKLVLRVDQLDLKEVNVQKAKHLVKVYPKRTQAAVTALLREFVRKR